MPNTRLWFTCDIWHYRHVFWRFWRLIEPWSSQDTKNTKTGSDTTWWSLAGLRQPHTRAWTSHYILLTPDARPNAGDTRSKNLYQKRVHVVLYLHVCRSILYKFFLYKFLACNRAQLHSRTETVWHVTRTVQHDWLASCCWARNCDELQIFHASFLHKFLIRVSWACVTDSQKFAV